MYSSSEVATLKMFSCLTVLCFRIIFWAKTNGPVAMAKNFMLPDPVVASREEEPSHVELERAWAQARRSVLGKSLKKLRSAPDTTRAYRSTELNMLQINQAQRKLAYYPEPNVYRREELKISSRVRTGLGLS